MLGISGTELIIILFFGFLIFGPEKLPQMGRTVGRAIRQFREASDTMSKKIKTEVADPFQEAISPYKEDVEKMGAPLKEDIAAINKNLQETKQVFTNPLKEALKPSSQPDTMAAGPKNRGTVTSAGTPATSKRPAASAATADPFADVISSASGSDDTPAADEKPVRKEGKPLPETNTSSIAASLYGLDDAKGGES